MRKPNGSLLIKLALVTTLISVGCSHDVGNRSVPIEAPQAFANTNGPEAQASERGIKWWLNLNDDALNQLIEAGLSDNLDLRQGWSRVAQLKAVARQQGATDLPQVQLGVGANRQRAPTFFGTTSVTNTLSMSLAASYEVDLWGKLESLQRAIALDASAAREDISAIAMTLSAQIADTWMAIIEQRARKALVDEQVAVSERFLELVSLRYAQGLASALEVYQQRQQLASVKAQRPLLESQQAVLEHQLATLLGKPPGSLAFAETTSLPVLPPLPVAGVPADLLIQRPDLRAAKLRLTASDERVAAAIADKFPSIRLTGTMAYQGESLNTLLDQFIWNLASDLVMPLIDGDYREAEVVRQRAVLEERLAAFGQAFLNALREVEDAIILERKQQAYIENLEAQRELAQVTLEQATARYTSGLSDYLSVLNALSGVQAAEQSLVSSQRRLISYRIQLHRALGGTWADALEQAPTAKRNSP